MPSATHTILAEHTILESSILNGAMIVLLIFFFLLALCVAFFSAGFRICLWPTGYGVRAMQLCLVCIDGERKGTNAD